MKKCFYFLLLVLVVGCANKRILRTDFSPVGQFDAHREIHQELTNSNEVAVFLKSAPEGFTLRENELEVEEGYSHIILGEIKVPTDRFTDWGRFKSTLLGIITFGGYPIVSSCIPPKNAKSAVIAAIQKAAFEQGANAVVYSVINLAEISSREEYVRAKRIGFGSGWVVVVEKKYLK